LDIYDAFYDWQSSKSWGGSGFPKSEVEKYSVGAVCLVNWNDTNGNGVPDHEETNITDNALGRNEVDLMKLVIRPRDIGLNLSGDVTLTQISGNSIRLWTSPVKNSGTEVPLPLTVDAGNLPMTLYIEALAPSSTVRDIVLEAEFAGETDRVSATAVWVELDKVYHENSQQIDMQLLNEFGCVENLLEANYDAEKDTYFGLGKPVRVATIPGGPSQTVIHQKARVLFQWQLIPADAYNLITIDKARQRHTNNWRLELKEPSGYDCKFIHQEILFPFNKSTPEDNEKTNDDGRYRPNICREFSFDSNGRYFSWDAPGLVMNQEFLEGDNFPQFWGYSNDKTNFLEWVRVAPKGYNLNIPFEGLGKIVGSRASDKVPWSYGRYSAKDNGFMLEVNTAPYALNHVRVNEIPDDHEYYPIEYQITQMDHSYTVSWYSAAIFNSLGDNKVIFLTRFAADENGDCFAGIEEIGEEIEIDDIPVEDSVYELPFSNHKIEITEIENFDELFLNWHTFYSTNKTHEFNYNLHLNNLNH